MQVKSDIWSLDYEEIKNLELEKNDEREASPSDLEEVSITAGGTEITIPLSVTALDTPTYYLTTEDIQKILKLYLGECDENKKLHLKIENYANKLIDLNKKYKQQLEKINERIGNFEEEISELAENIKELEEARTRRFKLPESWIIEDEEVSKGF